MIKNRHEDILNEGIDINVDISLEKNAIYRQIELVTDKLLKLYPAGFTIIVPPSNGNKYIADLMMSKSRNIMVVVDILLKVTTIETLDAAMENGSAFKKEYAGHVSEALAELRTYLDVMDKKYDGYFTRHMVKNLRMREVLVYTIKHSETAEPKYKKYIDGNDILLIDDSIHAVQTIKDAINIINSIYEPKSVTVLTLFSKLYPSGKK